MLLLITFWALLPLTLPVSGDCTLNSTHWATMLEAMRSVDFFTPLKESGQCTTLAQNGTGFLAKYADCTTALSVVLTNQALESTCPLSAGYCSGSLGSFVRDHLCDAQDVPGCPSSGSDLGKFGELVVCFGPVESMTEALAAAYFAAGNDKRCMRVSGKTFCNSFAPFSSCPVSFENVVSAMYTGDPPDHRCNTMFKNATNPSTNARCAQTTSALYYGFCPPQTFFEKYGAPLIGGICGGLIVFAGGVFCFKRITGEHITDDELMRDTNNPEEVDSHGIPLNAYPSGHMSPISTQGKMIHPELSAVMERKSKFKGITYDAQNRMWRAPTGQLYQNEMEAAQAGYYAQAKNIGRGSPKLLQGSSFSKSPSFMGKSFDNSGPIAAYAQEEPEPIFETPEQMMSRRKNQLINFYEFWDPERDDIHGHVENLFFRHGFEHVARAVQTKFGLLPPGWDFEILANDV